MNGHKNCAYKHRARIVEILVNRGWRIVCNYVLIWGKISDIADMRLADGVVPVFTSLKLY